MITHTCKLVDLPPGVYWLIHPQNPEQLCEKREGEVFVRFTNGSQMTYTSKDHSFFGPHRLALPAPLASTKPNDADQNEHRKTENGLPAVVGRFDDMRSRDQGLVTMTCNGIGGVHLRIEQRDRSRMAYAVFNPESGGVLAGLQRRTAHCWR